jgi:hypothetical protein
MKVLMVRGGWDGHEPVQTTDLMAEELRKQGAEVEISETLDAFKDEEKLKALDLIVPCWTMGKIEKDQVNPLLSAVASGVGMAGWHGGMCDAFRGCVQWEFATGGIFVAHPGGDGTPYSVNIRHGVEPAITEGVEDFDVSSEQYYMLVDPAVRVLATTTFPEDQIVMPVTWTKMWGRGRVFYTSLGHRADILAIEPARRMTLQGMLWAAQGKQEADKAEVWNIHQKLKGAF